jgi:hypothetical protein
MCYSYDHARLQVFEMQQSMIEQFASLARPVLDLPMIRRTRRNHGLEHATIHILSQRIKDLRMAGRSTDSGFVLLGEAPTEMVESAVHEALRRMRNGEHHLAVHPNCGTNLVTTGFLTTMAAMLGFTGASRRDVWNRMPAVMALVMAAILFSQPLGASLQRHITTDGDPSDLAVVSIRRELFRWPFSKTPVTMHRVITHSS